MSDAIALVIPFYNGSAYFDVAIRSVLTQTLPFAEIIVVNDGSHPDEQAFIEQAAARHGFRLISTENGGQGHARNIGAFAASSPWLCFLDQDDMLLPEHNRILLTAAQQLPADKAGWVFANFMTADAQARIISELGFPFAHDPIPATLTAFIGRDVHMLPSASIISRKAFCAVGGFDTRFRGYEDDDLLARLFAAGHQAGYVHEAVYVWRSHDEQTTRGTEFAMNMEKFVRKWRLQPLPETADRRVFNGSLYVRLNNTICHFLDHAEYRESWPSLRGITLRHALRLIRERRLLLLRQLLLRFWQKPQRLRRLLLAR